jgi:hypothetical protein
MLIPNPLEINDLLPGRKEFASTMIFSSFSVSSSSWKWLKILGIKLFHKKKKLTL